MKRNIRTVTYTAMLLALLICLQWLGAQIVEPTLKQLITGSFVNCVLAVAALTVGLPGAIAIALASPVMAFLLQIAPNFIAVAPIMVGNACFVVLIRLVAGEKTQWHWRKPVAVAVAAVAKFGVLYLLVVKLVCQVLAPNLLGKKVGDIVVLAPKMLKMLPAMFSWMQLITAIVGGSLAIMVLPLLKKTLHK